MRTHIYVYRCWNGEVILGPAGYVLRARPASNNISTCCVLFPFLLCSSCFSWSFLFAKCFLNYDSEVLITGKNCFSIANCQLINLSLDNGNLVSVSVEALGISKCCSKYLPIVLNPQGCYTGMTIQCMTHIYIYRRWNGEVIIGPARCWHKFFSQKGLSTPACMIVTLFGVRHYTQHRYNPFLGAEWSSIKSRSISQLSRLASMYYSSTAIL